VFAHGLSMHKKCFNHTLTNLLFSLCKFVQVVDLLVTLFSLYFGALARPFTLEVLQARECAPTLCPSVVFTFRFIVESIKEFGGASLLVHRKMLYNGTTILWESIIYMNSEFDKWYTRECVFMGITQLVV
jgi:hypothetical protein